VVLAAVVINKRLWKIEIKFFALHATRDAGPGFQIKRRRFFKRMMPI
jgi:hypothetical protein